MKAKISLFKGVIDMLNFSFDKRILKFSEIVQYICSIKND